MYVYLTAVVGLAAVLTAASDFSGVPGFVRNFVISFLALCGFIAAGVFLGVVFHAAFAGPIIID